MRNLFLIFMLGAYPLNATDIDTSKLLLPQPFTASSEVLGHLSDITEFKVKLRGPTEPRLNAALERFKSRWETERIHSAGSESIVADFIKEHPKSGAEPSNAEPSTLLEVTLVSKGMHVQSVREDESYVLNIDTQGVHIASPNPLGAMHALETLLQLQAKDQLPFTAIEDRPRFLWRGLLMDVCRHWMPLEVVKRNIDGLAAAKMNVLHLHLSEDQGFRVESKKYPKLHELGSDGNYYTQAQVKELIEYARMRGVRVMPEFDMPGHVTAWLVGHPELGSAPGPYAIERKFGIFDPAFDPSREEVFTFLDAFLGEMAALFPDEYFHTGGDENNGKQWNSNPAIQDFMAKMDFKTNEDLQAYFSGRVSKILQKHGKKMVGWDEILHTDLPPGTVVHVWRGPEKLIEAAERGFDSILSNGYYLDLNRPSSAHYAVDPGLSLTAKALQHVLGGEACMWTELVDPRNVDSRIWPRLLAVAERLWSPASVTHFASFHYRASAMSVRLTDLGLKHRSSMDEILFDFFVPKEMGAKSKTTEWRDLLAVRTLMTGVEPVEFYSRHRSRVYTSATPLDRLVDAADPESSYAVSVMLAVNDDLRDPNKVYPNYAKSGLEIWKKNDAALGPFLARNVRTKEAILVSKDLAAMASLGLEAIDYIVAQRQAPGTWIAKANLALRRYEQPKAELDLAALPAVRKLVLAASQWDKRATLGAEAWVKFLDEQIAAAVPKRR